MPNIPQQQTIVQYVASSLQTTYTFAFYAPEATDIQVYYQSSTATPVPAADILVLNVNYTVTFNADPTTGGFITLLFTPTTGYYLTIVRQVQASLNTNFANAQNFSGANLDAALDRLLLLCQQNQNYALERNLSYQINTYLPSASPYTQLPTLAQNYIWIGSGSGVVAALVSQVPSASVLQSMLANNSPGTDGGRIVGYYDIVANNPTTVTAFLNALPSYKSLASFVLDTGAANAYVVTPSPVYTSYYQGLNLKVLIANANTSSTCTLNVNSLGTKNIVLPNGLTPIPGDLVAGMIAELQYDGTNFQLLNPMIGRRTGSPSAAVYCSAAQVLSGGAAATVLFDTIEFDPLSMFVVASNGFKVPFAGKYRITAMLAFNSPSGSGANSCLIYLLKNGSLVKRLSGSGTISAVNVLNGDVIVSANANDVFTIDILKTDSANITYAWDGIGGSPQACSAFQIEYMGT